MIESERSYIAQTLDPLHVGAGGQRLGRVDMTVVREPATKVPKVPGTTLSGALKFFTDLQLRTDHVKELVCASTLGSQAGEQHDCGKCPICCAFGFTPADDQGKESAQGIVHFTDALLLAFPVQTVIGPVWISTKPRLLEQLHVGDGCDDCDEKFYLPEGWSITNPLDKCLNLGWALLQQEEKSSGIAVHSLAGAGLETRFAQRIVVVSEWVFSHLVNDNMEIRTSVVMNPLTGAAAKGGLFTYEAVPRGALFSFSLSTCDYFDSWRDVAWQDKPDSPRDMIEAQGFPGVRAIGLGGMTSRGFGRLAISALLRTAK